MHLQTNAEALTSSFARDSVACNIVDLYETHDENNWFYGVVLQRISTGVAGLDSLIEGGIPRGFTVLIAGNPGVGKTILSAHFLYEGLKNGENCLCASFSESKEQFYDNIERIGMEFRNFEQQKKFAYLDFPSITKDGMRDALDELFATIRGMNVKRLVVDSFSAISQAYASLIDSRIAVQSVLGKITRSEGITTLIIAEVPIGRDVIGLGVEEFVSDGIIRLTHGPDDASPTCLNIVKMRGTSITKESHVFSIGRNGIKLYTKHSLILTYPASEERVPSGVPGLDERIQGGLLRGTTTAIMGSTGVGKTTFAFQFIAKGVAGGEPGLFCSLEETADEIRRMARSFGYDMKDLERRGLEIMAKNAEDQSPDAFISELADEIKKTKATRLAVDSLSPFQHMYSNSTYVTTKRLSSLLRENNITGILTFLTEQQSGLLTSDTGLSSIFQNVIQLRYIELEGSMQRSMIILKMRSTDHDRSILGFDISSSSKLRSKDGLPEGPMKVAGPLKDVVGVLTGVAQRVPFKKAFTDKATESAQGQVNRVSGRIPRKEKESADPERIESGKGKSQFDKNNKKRDTTRRQKTRGNDKRAK